MGLEKERECGAGGSAPNEVVSPTRAANVMPLQFLGSNLCAVSPRPHLEGYPRTCLLLASPPAGQRREESQPASKRPPGKVEKSPADLLASTILPT